MINEVKKYLNKWDELDNYVLQESALDKLFFEVYPKNNDINDILIKASSLNDFYSTNIFSIFPVAKHILNLNIDERLENGDLKLVNELATITDLNKIFYSFASKYCSHHRPLIYPIYDSYVEKVLMDFNKKDKFYKFNKNDLRDYEIFTDVILNFRSFYGLDNFSVKEIDKYLWLLGKDKFPKKYN